MPIRREAGVGRHQGGDGAVMPLAVPLTVDIRIGASWAETH